MYSSTPGLSQFRRDTLVHAELFGTARRYASAADIAHLLTLKGKPTFRPPKQAPRKPTSRAGLGF